MQLYSLTVVTIRISFLNKIACRDSIKSWIIIIDITFKLNVKWVYSCFPTFISFSCSLLQNLESNAFYSVELCTYITMQTLFNESKLTAVVKYSHAFNDLFTTAVVHPQLLWHDRQMAFWNPPSPFTEQNIRQWRVPMSWKVFSYTCG